MPLLTGAKSTLQNFTTLPIDVGKCASIVHYFQSRGVSYGLGAKPLDYTAPIDANFEFVTPDGDHSSQRIDCSGMSKLLIYASSGRDTLIADGSVNQNDWFKAKGFKHTPIIQENDPQYLTGLNSSYVYVAFCRAGTRGETIGHVWLLAYINDAWWSLESHGGSGPDMRPKNYPTLARICTDVYVLGKNTPAA